MSLSGGVSYIPAQTTGALANAGAIVADASARARVSSFGVGLATADTGILMLLLNPTLSAPLAYVTSKIISEGTGTTQTVTAVGRVLLAIPVGSAGISAAVENNSLAWLGQSVAGTQDELVLAYMPLTTNQSVSGILNLMTY